MINIPKIDKKRVVIVGCGFAGLTLGRKLKNSGFQVVIIDKHNYHQFPPLFYQVASAGLEATSVLFPLRKIFQNYKDYHIRKAEVKGVDTLNNKLLQVQELLIMTTWYLLMVRLIHFSDQYRCSSIQKL